MLADDQRALAFAQPRLQPTGGLDIGVRPLDIIVARAETQRLRNRQKPANLPPLALEVDFEDMELRLEAFGQRILSYRQQMVNGPIGSASGPGGG